MSNSRHLVFHPGLTATAYTEDGGGYTRPRLCIAGIDDTGRPFSVDFYGKASTQPGTYSTPLDDLIDLLLPTIPESESKELTASESGDADHFANAGNMVSRHALLNAVARRLLRKQAAHQSDAEWFEKELRKLLASESGEKPHE